MRGTIIGGLVHFTTRGRLPCTSLLRVSHWLATLLGSTRESILALRCNFWCLQGTQSWSFFTLFHAITLERSIFTKNAILKNEKHFIKVQNPRVIIQGRRRRYGWYGHAVPLFATENKIILFEKLTSGMLSIMGRACAKSQTVQKPGRSL